ncbi:hypothetical protein COS93_02315 [bacterium (Candidatus Gribaldobacteria) CG07_land_8_20_14_0_80_33_18]|uniref:Uncharacterized protein n=1 Tax=bacterium (Candidatus Gribaldobacteria) CG07_land_8_20_14_0_80_33_18 TaxID=2014272 RepID=A0A2M6Z2H7_9BACT|nr:MAG: hypothetical protein COU04_00840 [bacterium (Candidatus Gribaldobacteria) CG10_big_fil_rev_8_21_14_0_10_33_41]PIU46545.1 MAG: hypothetical protein COS93_02315 [bacterium (Candidatus Gribaldobacteria) CG07_land_8_20_14_0_80_33_18]PJA00501.1 MAG: hypothetical protein COX75_02230 [bacterium (Candidatus Gribaldobacteria) CG_4_10_14_0_2_um_filter_33_15]PJB08263.1 MAG: hypothetical protein CO122_02235 [bacterium (Candidatus Gribaldobacteria) CG_4_9_14_3_um_filter_33_9]
MPDKMASHWNFQNQVDAYCRNNPIKRYN